MYGTGHYNINTESQRKVFVFTAVKGAHLIHRREVIMN